MEVSTSVLTVKKENCVKTFYNLEAAGTDYFHIDVMDGKFVEDDTSGLMREYCEYLNSITNVPLDVHLMVSDVMSYINSYMVFEPRCITIHYEAAKNKDELMKWINYIKENNINYLFISGDLYEHQYIKQSSIEFINNLFSEIPETKIYISAGNHDPKVKNSYYNKFNWNENVKIFSDKIEKIENEDANIYGYGFSDFYCKNSGIENVKIINKDKINILLMHGALNGGTMQDMEYNPLNKLQLKELGFDYIALGHIHKPMKVRGDYRRYCGTPLACSVSEAGQEKGVILVELGEKGAVKTEVLPLRPLRQVRVIRGSLEEVLGQACGDYVTVILTDRTEISAPDMQDRLRNAFPCLLEIRREGSRKADYRGEILSETAQNPYELCCAFLRSVDAWRDVDEEGKELLRQVINAVQEVPEG